MLAVAFFPVFVTANVFLFEYFFDESYLTLYIEHGALISLVASFVAIPIKDQNKYDRLISINPARFLGAHMKLIGAHLQVMGIHGSEAGKSLKDKGQKLKNGQSTANLEISAADVFDGIFGTIIGIFMMIIMTLWLLIVIPLHYFVVLFAGTPSRNALRVDNMLKKKQAENNNGDYPDLDNFAANVAASSVSMTYIIAAIFLFILQLVFLGDTKLD
jgi:hypothetical protein